MTRLAGIILAGGRSTRMGGPEKSLLRLTGETLIGHVARRISPQTEILAISANGDPARFASLRLPVIADLATEAGPLAGIQSGLQWAEEQGATHLLTVAADTPFFPLDLAERLMDASLDVPAMASSADRMHPVFCLWPVSAAAPLSNWLDEGGSRSVTGFCESMNCKSVAFEVPDISGRPADPFFNINTPEDLAEAEELVQHIQE
jgi:molybdopterin-guanine dinucleotide biosynthesis protein A